MKKTTTIGVPVLLIISGLVLLSLIYISKEVESPPIEAIQASGDVSDRVDITGGVEIGIKENYEEQPVRNDLGEGVTTDGTNIYNPFGNVFWNYGNSSPDVATFEVLSSVYASDKNTVYSISDASPLDDLHGVMDSINVSAFRVIDSFYAADDSQVIRSSGPATLGGPATLLGADPVTFTVLWSDDKVSVSKDIDDVWYISVGNDLVGGRYENITAADAETFVIEEYPYFSDKKRVYRMVPFSPQLIEDIDPDSIVITRWSSLDVVRDMDTLYIDGSRIEDIDATTARYIGESNDRQYFKDNNRVWIAFTHGCCYAKQGFQIIEGADPNTFEILADGTLRDKDNVWKRTSDQDVYDDEHPAIERVK